MWILKFRSKSRDKSITSKAPLKWHFDWNIVKFRIRAFCDSWFQSSAPTVTGDLSFLGQKHDTTSCEFRKRMEIYIWPIYTMFRLFIYTFCYLLPKTREKESREIGIHFNDDDTTAYRWQPNVKWITASSHYSPFFIFIQIIVSFSFSVVLESTLHFMQFINV